MRIVQVSVGSVRIPPLEGWAPMQVMLSNSRQLASAGHDVVILDRKYSEDDPDVEPFENVRIIRLDVPQLRLERAPRFIRFLLAEFNALMFAVRASRYLRESGDSPAIVHMHVTSIGLVLSLLNRNLRGKMVYTSHLGQWTTARHRACSIESINVLLDACLMRRVAKVIALNEAARQEFIAKGKIEAGKVTVIPNGVDTSYFYPNIDVSETVSKFGLQGRLVILFVGRLARIKGVAHLLRAADIVVNELGADDALFALAGPDAYDATEGPVRRNEIREFIGQHGLQNHVLLTGSLPLSEVRKLYAAADMFILPSLVEGDPLVTLEAMASGLPIIATRVGGIPNQVIDGWNGFLVPPGGERVLAERVQYLMDHPTERGRMGYNSRQRASEMFDWERVAEKLIVVYHETMSASQTWDGDTDR